MSRRIAIVTAAVIALSGLVAGPAAAADKKKLRIVGGLVFKAGKYVKDDQRFAPRNLAIRKGGKVRLRNKARTPDPHSISVVRRRQLPSSFDCPVCADFFAAHEVNEETGDVGKPRVDVGDEGFDRPGDSLYVPPKGTVNFKVTAPRGKTLHYICAVHPWMQGKIRVK